MSRKIERPLSTMSVKVVFCGVGPQWVLAGSVPNGFNGFRWGLPMVFDRF